MTIRQLNPVGTTTPTMSFTPVRSGLLQRKCACGGTPGPSGECEACRKKKLQRKARNSESGSRDKSSVPPIVHEVLRSPGQPLNPATREFMEPRFGHDFSRVRRLIKLRMRSWAAVRWQLCRLPVENRAAQ